MRRTSLKRPVYSLGRWSERAVELLELGIIAEQKSLEMEEIKAEIRDEFKSLKAFIAQEIASLRHELKSLKVVKAEGEERESNKEIIKPLLDAMGDFLEDLYG